MAANSSINLIDLDFASLKANFKNYLRNQSIFKDYDLEGSNMAVLIDLLSYNTFKNAFYTNMLFAESFIDSAQLRGSLVSHAKELNYTPRSARSSKARVSVTFTATGDTQPYTIQKGQSFSALVKSSNFTFTIPETISVSSSNTTFSFETDIYEGIYVTDSYVFKQIGDAIPRFKITNKNIDTDSLIVTVFEDNSVEGTTYTLTNTLLDLDFASKVYFLQCNENEFYEIYFGDNVLGQKPKDFSTIVLNYRIAQGSLADGALSFAINFNPTGAQSELTSSLTVDTVEVSRGGASSETAESIRFYAPRAFQVQERTVTASDYEIALKTQFPEINAVYAYGGETVDPPRFGRVFVAVDISNVDGFPDSKKQQYKNFVKNRAPFSIEPIFVEPERSYLNFDILVRYNVSVSKLTAETIKTIITNTVLAYRDVNLNDFNVTFRNSQLSNDIDQSDVSIVSSIQDVQLYKKVDIIPGISQNVIIKFDTELLDTIPQIQDVHPATDLHCFTTSPFRLNGLVCVYEDDGNGTVRLVKTEGATHTKIYDVGTIDYETGIINLPNITVGSFIGDAVKFYVRPRDPDITSKNNTILSVEEDAINVTVEAIRV